MAKEKFRFDSLFLFIFLLIPDITIRTSGSFWNGIFVVQSSLKYIVVIYILFSVIYRERLAESRHDFVIAVYLLYFLPIFLFKMFIAF